MKEKEIDLFDMIKVLWKRKWFIILNVFWITSVSIVISLFLPKHYKATTIIMPQTSAASPMSMLSGLQNSISFGRLFGNNTDQFKILAIMKSRTLKKSVVKKFNLVEKYQSENIQEAIKKFGDKNLEVKIGDEMQIKISVWDTNQDVVDNIANYTVQCLDSINIALSTSQAKEVKNFMSGRVEDVLDSLYVLENEIIDFMKSNNIADLENQVFVGLETASKIKASLLQKKIQLSIAKNNFKEGSSELSVLKEEIKALETSYHNQLSGSGDHIIPNFSKVPEFGIKIKELERKVEYYSTLLKFLGPEYENARLNEKKDVPTIQILDYAVRPEKKDKPKRSLIVITVFLISGLLTTSYILIKGKKYFISSSNNQI